MTRLIINISVPSVDDIQQMEDLDYVKSLYLSANRQARDLDIYIEALLKRRLELMEKEKT